MAELLATGVLSSLFGGGAAATAGASLGGGLAATAAGAGAAGSSALSILQGVASAVAAIGAIGTGLSAMAASNEQANATELQAGQEQVETTNRQLARRRELARILGDNEVAFAASGVDVAGGGIAQDTALEARREAAFDMGIDRDQDEYRRALLKVRARGLRRRGGEQMFSGLLGAVDAGLGFGMDLVERG